MTSPGREHSSAVNYVAGPSTTVYDMYNFTVVGNTTTGYQGQGQGGGGGYISQPVFDILSLLIAEVSMPIIEVFGITSNSINLIVFWSMGLKDSVKFSLFALSLSDMCYLLVNHAVWLMYILHRLEVQKWVKLDELSYFMIWYVHWLLSISTLITTYIAVQRCFCVALPLRMKSFFTPTRNIVVIACLCLSTVVLFVPLQTYRGLRVFIDPSTNVSWVGVWYAEKQEAVLEVTYFIVGMSFPIAAQFVTVVCMFILVVSLRKSSRFRETTSTSGKELESDAAAKTKANTKEVQVVKAVTFVTLMFILSNTLPVIQILTRALVPSFRLYSNYRNLFILVGITKDAILQLNASLNIFIYYSFNTAYRTTFKKVICHCCRKQSKQLEKN